MSPSDPEPSVGASRRLDGKTLEASCLEVLHHDEWDVRPRPSLLVDQPPGNRPGQLERDGDRVGLVALDHDQRAGRLVLIDDQDRLVLSRLGMHEGELGAARDPAAQITDQVAEKRVPATGLPSGPDDFDVLSASLHHDDVGNGDLLGAAGIDRHQGLVLLHLVLEIGRRAKRCQRPWARAAWP